MGSGAFAASIWCQGKKPPSSGGPLSRRQSLAGQGRQLIFDAVITERQALIG